MSTFDLLVNAVSSNAVAPTLRHCPRGGGHDKGFKAVDPRLVERRALTSKRLKVMQKVALQFRPDAMEGRYRFCWLGPHQLSSTRYTCMPAVCSEFHATKFPCVIFYSRSFSSSVVSVFYAAL